MTPPPNPFGVDRAFIEEMLRTLARDTAEECRRQLMGATHDEDERQAIQAFRPAFGDEGLPPAG